MIGPRNTADDGDATISSGVSSAPLLLVLNDDTVICEDCHEPSDLEVDPALVPFAHIGSGRCKHCGLTIGAGTPRAPGGQV